MILLVIGFYFVRQRTVPSVALPPLAVSLGTTVKVPVQMQSPRGTAEVWVLTRDPNHRYYVSVFVKQQLVHRFEANQLRAKDSTGANYTSVGQLKFDGQLYQVSTIHINDNETSGYIQFVPAAQSKP